MFYADFEGSAKTKSLLTAKSRKLPEKIYGELDCGYFCPRLTSSPTAFVYSSNLIIFSEKEHKTDSGKRRSSAKCVRKLIRK